MKQSISGALSHIIITDSSRNQVRIYNKEELHKKLIERNTIHFRQSDGTPFTTEPMKSILGKFATTPDSQAILDGTYDIEAINTTPAVKSILWKAKRIAPANSIPSEISADDLESGYKKWRAHPHPHLDSI